MDALSPILEAAFSKAFGTLTKFESASVSISGRSGTNNKNISSGWTVAIVSYTLVLYEGGTGGATLLVPYTGFSVGNTDARADLYSSSMSAYSRAPAYGASISVITFKEE